MAAPVPKNHLAGLWATVSPSPVFGPPSLPLCRDARLPQNPADRRAREVDLLYLPQLLREVLVVEALVFAAPERRHQRSKPHRRAVLWPTPRVAMLHPEHPFTHHALADALHLPRRQP